MFTERWQPRTYLHRLLLLLLAHQHKAAGRKTRLGIQNYGCNDNLHCDHTAFPLCRAMERRWKRNVVSRVSSVIVVNGDTPAIIIIIIYAYAYNTMESNYNSMYPVMYTGPVPAIKSEATALFAPQDGRWKITVSFDGRRFCVPKFRH